MWRRFWQRCLKNIQHSRPTRRLTLEPLEDRLTPATLDSTGIGLVTYSASGGIANAVTISTDGTTYTINDTAETINLTAGATAAGWSGSGANTVTGPNINVFTIAVDTGDQNDTVTVESLAHPLAIDTGSGAGNAVLVGGVAGVGAQNVNGPVDVMSTGGNVALTVDDSGNSAAVFAQLDADKVRDLVPYNVTFAPGDLSSLDVLGGSGGNLFVVNATVAGITTTLQAGAGTDQTTVLATTGSLAYEAAGGTDALYLGDAGLTANLSGSISVSAGSGGSVNLFVDDSADATGQSATVTATGVTGLTPGGVTWTAADLSDLQLSSGFGNDTFTVNNTPAGVTTQIRLGEGDDLITINVVTTGLFVDGNAGDDTYAFTLGGGSTTIADSAGSDTIDFSLAPVGVTIDMDSTAVQNFAGGTTIQFAAPSIVENFVGSAFNDTVTAQPLAVPRSIDGSAPVLPASPGDTLTLELQSPPLATAPTNGTLTVTGPGAATYTSDQYAPVTYTSIETFNPTALIPNIIIDATVTSTDFRIVRSGANEQVYDITGVASGFPGSLYFSMNSAFTQTLTVKGTTAEANRVVLDFGGSGTPIPDSNANPIPSGGFVFDGKAINDGATAGTDRLVIGSTSASGTPTLVTFSAVDTTYTGATSGSTTFTDTTPTVLGTVSFNNLDAYDLSGGLSPTETAYNGSIAIKDLTFNLPAGAIPATFQDTGTATDNVSQLVTTTGNPTAFVATNFPDPSTPNNSLSVNTSAPGNDTVSLGGMDQGFHPTLINFTGTSTGDTFKLTSANFFQAPAPGVTLTSVTLDLNGISDTVAWLQDTPPAGTSVLALSSNAVLTTGDTTDRVLNGQVVGSGGLIKQGSGSWALGGATDNTFTGTTTVNAGTLLLDKLSQPTSGIAVSGALVIGNDGTALPATARLEANNQTSSSSPVTVNTTGLLDLAGFSDTIGSLTLESGSTTHALVTTGAGTLTLGGNVTLNVTGSGASPAVISGNLSLGNATRTFTVNAGSPPAGTGDLDVQAVVSNGALTKTGPGVLALDAANIYSGPTTINGGTLLVTGSLYNAPSGPGVVTLNATGVFLLGGGTGVINGQVVVNANNGTVQSLTVQNIPGSGAGITVKPGFTGALLGGSTAVKGVTVLNSGTSTGVLVQAGAGSAASPVTVNHVTVTGLNGGSDTSIGIQVSGLSGGSVTPNLTHAVLLNSAVNFNNLGIDVSDATALVQGTNLDNNTAGSYATGLQVENGAIVDAGQTASAAANYYGNFTLLGISTGTNSFHGYSSAAPASTPTAPTDPLFAVPLAIRNLNTNPPNNLPNAQLHGNDGLATAFADVTAQNDDYGAATTIAQIEQLLFHDLDNFNYGFIAASSTTTAASAPNVVANSLVYYADPRLTDPVNFSNTTGKQHSVIRYLQMTLDSFSFLDPNHNRGLSLVKNNGPYGAAAGTNIAGTLYSATYNYSTGQYTVVYALNGPGTEFGSVEDGNYTLDLQNAYIQGGGPGGPPLATKPGLPVNFYRYFGDYNGDAIVVDRDVAALRAVDRTQLAMSKYLAYFDFNADGSVDEVDNYQVLRRYRSSMSLSTGAVSAVAEQVTSTLSSLSASLSNGTLTLSGKPRGILNITLTSGNVLQVRDMNGNSSIGNYMVTGDLIMNLTGHPDAININLGGFTFAGNITIDLGGGDLPGHPVNIYNGTINQSVTVKNGSGLETVSLGLPGLVNTTPLPLTVRGSINATMKTSGGGTTSPGDTLFVGPGASVQGNITLSQVDGFDIGEQNPSRPFNPATVGGAVTVDDSNAVTALTMHVYGNVTGNVKVTGTTNEDIFDLERTTPASGGTLGGTLTVDLGSGGPYGNVISLGAGTVVNGTTSLTSGPAIFAPGSNRFTVAGTVNQGLTVTLGSSGTNVLAFTGVVGTSMTVTGGTGLNDLGGGGLGGVFSGTVGGNLTVTLSGTNFFAFTGLVGTAGTNYVLSYTGGSGVDKVSFAGNNSSTILTVNLGGGDGDALIFAPSANFFTSANPSLTSTIRFGPHTPGTDIYVAPILFTPTLLDNP